LTTAHAPQGSTVSVTGEVPAVACTGLSRDFGDGANRRRVIDSIDLLIRSGEMTLLVGPSGCGKTTLVSLMAGLLSPTVGSVRVFGRELAGLDVKGLTAFRLREVGFIFQQFNLLPTLSAAENAGLPLCAQGMGRSEATASGRRTLERLGMAEHADKLPGQLSGGQQQRVAIARALVHAPRLVVCDEPTSALDANSGRAVMQLLTQVAVDAGRAVVVVTHDSRVYDFADRIVDMEDGHLTGDRRPSPRIPDPRALAQNTEVSR
jgi:putative ABC transport system ATP-binding protein